MTTYIMNRKGDLVVKGNRELIYKNFAFSYFTEG